MISSRLPHLLHLFVVVLCLLAPHAVTGSFTDTSSWSAYDADNTDGLRTIGYAGAVWDGRFVYFSPYYDSGAHHGKVLRYDMQGSSFNASSDWDAYDAGNTDGLVTVGYIGAVFDDQFVYFVPTDDGTVAHGRVLRYDTQGGSFNDSSSWSAYDAGTTDGLMTVGYFGAAWDGRFIYFAPSEDDTGIASHGRVLRYDTQGSSFTDASSWSAYDAGNTDGLLTVGYRGAVWDGWFVYFVPWDDGSGPHGRVLRYDTQGSTFNDSSSWSAYDAGNTDGLATVGYSGAVWDGRFVYFAPRISGAGPHGITLRYDTQGSAFNASSSWTAYDAGNTAGLDTVGYNSGVWDGRFVYFVPHEDSSVQHGRVLRYDTQGSAFNDSGSWSAYDAGITDGLKTVGFVGAVFDNQSVYFVPYYDGSVYHARVLRYEAIPPLISTGTSGTSGTSGIQVVTTAISTASAQPSTGLPSTVGTSNPTTGPIITTTFETSASVTTFPTSTTSSTGSGIGPTTSQPTTAQPPSIDQTSSSPSDSSLLIIVIVVIAIVVVGLIVAGAVLFWMKRAGSEDNEQSAGIEMTGSEGEMKEDPLHSSMPSDDTVEEGEAQYSALPDVADETNSQYCALPESKVPVEYEELPVFSHEAVPADYEDLPVF